MRSDAASAGFYDSPWGRHPRLQFLTVEELLDGKGIDYQAARLTEPGRADLRHVAVIRAAAAPDHPHAR